MRKTREKCSSHSHYLMGLSARARHLPCNNNVLTITVHPPEGVTGEGSRWRLVPGHNHPSVQAACQRYPNAFPTIEVPGEILRKNLAEFLVAGFWFQGCLLFPFPRLEIRRLALKDGVLEDPGRSRWQYVDAIEQRPVR